MSYKDFNKKFRNHSSTTKIDNPYTKSAKPAQDDFEGFEPNKGAEKGILDGQNKHLYSLVLSLQREVKELKEDLASLYSMLEQPDVLDELTEEETRERYMLFKTDKRHLLNRKIKRFNGDRDNSTD